MPISPKLLQAAPEVTKILLPQAGPQTANRLGDLYTICVTEAILDPYPFEGPQDNTYL